MTLNIKIAKLLHEHQIYLIEDDVYEELFYGGQKTTFDEIF